MIGRNPEYVLYEEVHAIDSEGEETEEEELVVSLHARENRPIILGPHIRLEFVHEGLHLIRARCLVSGRLRFLIDPVKSSDIEIVASIASKQDAEHVAAKEIKQQL